MKYFSGFVLIISIFLASYSYSMDIIADPEIDDILMKIIKPIIKVASLNASKIKINLINDREINAFVMDDGNIFIHLGLLTETDHPSEVIGVLAHEIAHVSLNHHNKRAEEIREAMRKNIFPSIIISRLSKYSVMQEHAADKTAAVFLSKLGISTQGLINALKKIKNSRIDMLPCEESYRTHPELIERINYLATANIKNNNKLINNKDFLYSYDLMMAKTRGFLWSYDDVMRIYSGERVQDLYARAFAYYKSHKISKALEVLGLLINKQSNNPYFYEAKAQLLLESGVVSEAIEYYTKALRFATSSNLIKKSLMQALLLSEKKKHLEIAHEIISSFHKDDVDFDVLWSAGIVNAKLGRVAESYLFFAKASIKVHNIKNAKRYLELAKNHIKQTNEILKDAVVDIESLIY